MGQDIGYVGLLPPVIDFAKVRYFGRPDIGEYIIAPCKDEPKLDDIGAVATHFAQFLSKNPGVPHMVPDFELMGEVKLEFFVFDVQNAATGKTNYSVYLTPPNKKKEEKFSSISIRRDLECDVDFGILELYYKEIKSKPDAVAQAK